METHTNERVARLAKAANTIRRLSLKMVHKAKLGHPGGDLSAADILAVLYGAVLRIDPQRPDWPERDRFIMSKGHATASFYVALCQAGFFPESELSTYMQPMTRLAGHPDRTKLPGVEASTGALGHGLPFAVGTAIAAKLDGSARRTFVLTGDGELQEGSNWEAMMSAAQFGLDHLTLIVDRNRIQQGDFTENTVRLEPLAAKLEAFGWAVREVAGNNPAALLEAFESLPLEAGKPNALIARTTKGCGVSFIENQPSWHHHVPTDDELRRALAELGEVAQ